MDNREFKIAVDDVRNFGNQSVWGWGASEAVKILVKNLQWNYARATTFARSDASEADLISFETGGMVSGRDADSWLADGLKNLLKTGGKFVLVEDWLLDKGDEIIDRYSYPSVYFKKEVFYILDRDETTFDLACVNMSPRFLGFVIEGPAPVVGSDLSEAMLETMSTHVALVYFGAWDGEGYVVVTFDRRG